MLRSRKFITLTEEERTEYTTMRLLFHAIPKKTPFMDCIPEINDLFDYLIQHLNQLQIALTHVDGLADTTRNLISETRKRYYLKSHDLGLELHIHPTVYRMICPILHHPDTVKKIKSYIECSIKLIPHELHSIWSLYIYAELIDYAIIEWMSAKI
jgi:hypothetical protein